MTVINTLFFQSLRKDLPLPLLIDLRRWFLDILYNVWFSNHWPKKKPFLVILSYQLPSPKFGHNLILIQGNSYPKISTTPPPLRHYLRLFPKFDQFWSIQTTKLSKGWKFDMVKNGHNGFVWTRNRFRDTFSASFSRHIIIMKIGKKSHFRGMSRNGSMGLKSRESKKAHLGFLRNTHA